MKKKTFKVASSLLVVILIALGIYCISLNKKIKYEKENYNKLHTEYSELVLKYNDQVEKIDKLNTIHAKEIEELNKQSIQLVDKIDELTQNMNILKEDLEKMKK